METDRLSDFIEQVLEFRRRAWDDVRRLSGWQKNNKGTLIAERLPRICVLASSSRGGTSVTAELLQWQGADCSEPSRRLLTLPGEEKPHLILAGLGFPARHERFDDLTEAETKEELVSQLLNEIASEIGYPMASCNNLLLYATQLYRRLLLQWPSQLTELKTKEAIALLARSLQISFPKGYRDSLRNRRQVLAICVHCFPFIRPSFYDCWQVRSAADLTLLTGGPWSIEETPFVLPPPWHNATSQEIEQGCLLLRDPSNAWRMGFWRAIFPRQRIVVLHLVRDPRESVQGLCDGWNYPFGFQTMPSERALVIHGYTDKAHPRGSVWKNYQLNFSVDRTLSRKLLDERRALTLVEICAHQWRRAHESILTETQRLGLDRTVVNFADLRVTTERAFRDICAKLDLESSQSGLAYARSFPERWIMAIAPAMGAGHERWKTSDFAAEIRALASSGLFDEVALALGMDKISSQHFAVSPADDSHEIGLSALNPLDFSDRYFAKDSLLYA
jgi:hypothetical protein